MNSLSDTTLSLSFFVLLTSSRSAFLIAILYHIEEWIHVEVRKSRSVKKRMENEVLRRLKNLRPRSHRDTWLLHHDNASAHRSNKTVVFLVMSDELTLLDHPPCGQDLAPCDFYLFPEVKKQLKGRQFSNESELLHGWDQLCRSLGRDIPALVHWVVSTYGEVHHKKIHEFPIFIAQYILYVSNTKV